MTDKKGTFLGLALSSYFLLCLLALLFWRLSDKGLREMHPLFPLLFGVVLLLFLASLALAILLLLSALVRGKEVFWGERIYPVLLCLFHPLTLLLGRLVSISRDRIERSFIEVNNGLVKARRSRYALKNILLLMPHCLQDAACPVRITHEVKNCRSCGRCNVRDLLAIAEAYGAHLRIASGGMSARRFLLEYKPEAVIAVACERDLSSGIRDSLPLPVIGILNQRPYGYCLNTRIDLSQVKEAIQMLTGKEEQG